MKVRLYTRSHRADLLDTLDRDTPFTAEEHALVTGSEHPAEFSSRDSLIRWYTAGNAEKLHALPLVLDTVRAQQAQTVVSMGAGPCVLEYLLQLCVPAGCRVIATDFDAFLIGHARRHFPEIQAEPFDFSSGDTGDLREKCGGRIDIALFLGSSYVMDDDRFVTIFGGLRDGGISRIIDFHAGYIPYRAAAASFAGEVLDRVEGALRVSRGTRRAAAGKFHGYGRTRGALRHLYRRAGLTPIRELVLPPYEYVAVLAPR